MTTAQLCCVDHALRGTKAIGGRWFCDEHYAKATYQRQGVWRSEITAVIGLLVFVAIVVGLDAFLRPDLTGTALLLTGVVLAVVPAFLWLTFFYRQDRLEPEPVGHVARLFVVGLALAGAVGIPLTHQLFRIEDWLYRDGLTTVLGSIFVTGAVQAFIVYAAVRYFVFDSPEFDERADGVIYGTAAGLGYATALNLQFILSNGGAALGQGEIFVAEVALAQAAFGGLLGYFLGKSKLEQEPTWWLAAGFTLTAVLNGVFNLLRGQLDQGTISRGQGGLPSFSGLLLSGALAIGVTILVTYLIRRDIARNLSGLHTDAAGDPAVGDRQSALVVVGAFVVLLLVGAFAWNNAVNRTQAFAKDGFGGAYPAYYSDATGEGEVLRVVDTLGTGAVFSITSSPASGLDAEDVARQLAGDRSTDFEVYRVTSRGEATVNGRPALMQRFAYVDPNGLLGAVPEVMEGIDYVIVEDGRAVVITLLTTPDDLPNVEALFARFLNGLSF